MILNIFKMLRNSTRRLIDTMLTLVKWKSRKLKFSKNLLMEPFCYQNFLQRLKKYPHLLLHHHLHQLLQLQLKEKKLMKQHRQPLPQRPRQQLQHMQRPWPDMRRN